MFCQRSIKERENRTCLAAAGDDGGLASDKLAAEDPMGSASWLSFQHSN